MAERRRLDDMSAKIDEAAARWHLAQADDDMDWAAFTDWLEADPRHREAFDAITLLDERIDAAQPMLAEMLAEPDQPAQPRRKTVHWGIWGAVAAMLVAAILSALVLTKRADEPVVIAYRTGPGQMRTIRLPDGSRAILGPGSVLRVSASRDQALMLDGKAVFDVRHDPAHPLTVMAEGYSIRDVGTRFEIATGDAMLRVAVAEGEVAVGGAGQSGTVPVMAGEALMLRTGSVRAEVQAISGATVGGWRNGPLVYDAVPLGMVVADIARTSGQRVTIAPVLADRRFSGLIAPGDGRAMAASLAALTGLNMGADGDAIRLGDHR